MATMVSIIPVGCLSVCGQISEIPRQKSVLGHSEQLLPPPPENLVLCMQIWVDTFSDPPFISLLIYVLFLLIISILTLHTLINFIYLRPN